jgi:hypothetical protein
MNEICLVGGFFMSTTAISSASSQQQVPPYQQRKQDLVQLANALKSGDLNGAEKAYAAIVQLGKTYGHGQAFKMANREQDFEAVGKALQAGDLAGAKKSLEALRQTFQRPQPSPVMAGSGSSAGPAAVVTLSSGQ